MITSDELKACYNAEVFNTFIEQHAKQKGKTKTVYEKATTSAPRQMTKDKKTKDKRPNDSSTRRRCFNESGTDQKRTLTPIDPF